MKIILISDTHNRHDDVISPQGDLLIHAGDFSGRGRIEEVQNFLNWFSNQPHPYKILIAGNHDFFFEKESEDIIREIIPDNINYLNDSGVTIEGLKIWGSPVQPEFFDWAFNRQRGLDIKTHWDLIPRDTDIIITYGPPYGILDQTTRNIHAGCEELAKAVTEIRPKLHVFGHIHEAYGIIELEGIKYVNASLLNERYHLVNDAITLEI